MANSRQEKVARYKEQKEQERRLKVVKILPVINPFAGKFHGLFRQVLQCRWPNGI